jgi:hypothetical protein
MFFSYEKTDSTLKLTGDNGDDSLMVSLQAFDTENFRLLSRGFNWINEFPHNR